MSFQDDIKKWVVIDNQIKQLNDKTKELKNEKKQIETSILGYVENNNLNNATTKIMGGRLRFVETRQVSPISLNFLNQCLSECIKNDNQVKYIMEYIKNKRDVKLSKDIKRYYDKE